MRCKRHTCRYQLAESPETRGFSPTVLRVSVFPANIRRGLSPRKSSMSSTRSITSNTRSEGNTFRMVNLPIGVQMHISKGLSSNPGGFGTLRRHARRCCGCDMGTGVLQPEVLTGNLGFDRIARIQRHRYGFTHALSQLGAMPFSHRRHGVTK